MLTRNSLGPCALLRMYVFPSYLFPYSLLVSWVSLFIYSYAYILLSLKPNPTKRCGVKCLMGKNQLTYIRWVKNTCEKRLTLLGVRWSAPQWGMAQKTHVQEHVASGNRQRHGKWTDCEDNCGYDVEKFQLLKPIFKLWENLNPNKTFICYTPQSCYTSGNMSKELARRLSG